jgi:hypothetical protein
MEEIGGYPEELSGGASTCFLGNYLKYMIQLGGDSRRILHKSWVNVTGAAPGGASVF